MKHMPLYSLVRIVQLLQEPEYYGGGIVNQRPPTIGDMGTIVEILHGPELADKYIVEASDAGGRTIWIADFDTVELEPIDGAAYVPPQAERKSPDSA